MDSRLLIPDVAVIIVSWNTRDLLAACLRSVGDPPRAQVMVVDNGSSDGSAGMVRRQFPRVRLVENQQNLGFAAANNQAIRLAGTKESNVQYILLLNSDAELRTGALDTLVTWMEGHPRCGAAGAMLLYPDGTLQPSCHPMLTPGREFWRLLFLDRLWPRATYPMQRWSATEPRPVEVIKGACLMLRWEALDQVDLFDERYFMYTEEVDLCYRLAQAGWELWWVPAAEVVHHEAQSSRLDADRMYVQLYRSKVLFYRKFGGEEQARRFKSLLKLAYRPRLAAATIGGLVSQSLAARAGLFRRLLADLPEM
jgi:hypothetical protein